MSETPKDTTGVAPPVPRNSPLDPPARRRLDPAAIMIGVGGAVLLVALWWLLNTPRASTDASVDPARVASLEQRLGALETIRSELGAIGGRLGALSAVEGRVQALESRPAPVAPDLRPIEQQISALTERAAANERRIAALEGRPAFDPAAVASRPSLEALATRIEQMVAQERQQEADLIRRLQEAQRADEQREQAAQQALQQRLQELTRAGEQREQAMQQRLQELVRAGEQREQAMAQRLQEMQRAGEQREQAAQQALTGRLQEAQRADEQREQAALQALTGRLQALEASLAQRAAALEQAQQAVRAQMDRATRLAAVERMRGALEAGEPLGDALGIIGQPPPPALARFAQAAAPTEAGLRQSFEEAVRAARAVQAQGAAAESGRPAGVEGALAKIEGLVTARRGDQMLWGDSIEPELERARRALEAGNLEMSLQYIEKLPAPVRDAMQSWVDQARALLAARAALRQLAAG